MNINCDYQGLVEVVGLSNGVGVICNEEGKLLVLRCDRRSGVDDSGGEEKTTLFTKKSPLGYAGTYVA